MVTPNSSPLRPDCDTTSHEKHVGGCDSLTKSKQQSKSRRRHNIIVLVYWQYWQYDCHVDVNAIISSIFVWMWYVLGVRMKNSESLVRIHSSSSMIHIPPLKSSSSSYIHIQSYILNWIVGSVTVNLRGISAIVDESNLPRKCNLVHPLDISWDGNYGKTKSGLSGVLRLD